MTRLAVVPFLCLAGAAGAETVYDCEIRQEVTNNNWLPEQVVVGFDTGEKSAVVYDPIIAHFIGNPIEAKVEVDNAKRTTFVWKVKTTVGGVTMSYRLTVLKADLSASMQGRPLGYDQDFTSTGRCQRAAK